MEPHVGGWTARVSALCAFLFILAPGTPVLAVLDLKRGDEPPGISARCIHGEEIDLAQMHGRTVILLFAEAGHERTQQAARSIASARMQESLSGKPVTVVALYTKGSDGERIAVEARDMRAALPESRTVHDVERHAFGAYHVVAIPSTVIIGPDGRVVHSLAGLSPRFEYIVSDALLLSTGQMSEEAFERALNGVGEESDEKLRRAERLAQTARRLAERGQYELAEQQYLEALTLAPRLIAARLGLADLLVRRGRLDDAEMGFRSVLSASPRSLEAAAGLALVHALRGEADEAERLALGVLDRSPLRARAHYALGIVHEQRGEYARAAECFRRAADLLLAKTELMNGESASDP